MGTSSYGVKSRRWLGMLYLTGRARNPEFDSTFCLVDRQQKQYGGIEENGKFDVVDNEDV